MINIYGSKYESIKTNFEVMMNDDKFKNTLFIFNDNEKEHFTNKKGRGNACMRQYNSYSDLLMPRSAGIPTGEYRKGYTKLDKRTKDVINNAIELIKCLLQSGHYDSIIYSVNSKDNPQIDTALFNVNQNVLEYITNEILNLGNTYSFVKYNNGKYITYETISIND